jgi:glycosyltransferase involved in cell wall biosynthesis
VASRESLSHSLIEKLPIPFFEEPKTAMALAKYAENCTAPSHFITNGMHGWALSTAQRKIPTISMIHSTYEGYTHHAFPSHNLSYWRMHALYAPFERASARNADECVVNSRFTASEVKKYFVVNPVLIELPIDTTLFSPGSKLAARKKLGWKSERPIVLFAGNPVYAKGFDVVEKIAASHPEWHVHAICVSPPANDQPAMTIIPGKPRNELVNYFRAADVLLFPSRYEGFGLVPMEALASGCPIVTSKVGIFHDFQPNGVEIVEHSIRGFEEGIARTLSKSKPMTVPSEMKTRFSMKTFQKAWESILMKGAGQ